MYTYSDIKIKSKKYYQAILLDKFQSHHTRRKFRKFLFYTLIFLLILLVISSSELLVKNLGLSILNEYIYKIRGLALLAGIIYLKYFLLEAFYRSFYFKETEISFELANIILLGDDNDITKTFFRSNIGRYIMLRCGIASDELNKFLENKEKQIPVDHLQLNENKNNQITVFEYADFIYSKDEELQRFLNKFNITKEIFNGAVKWVSESEYRIKDQERWWTKNSLIRIQSIGANWSFGKTYLLEKYGHSIYEDVSYSGIEQRWKIYKEYVEKLEQVLIKDNQANAMLIVPVKDIGMNIISTMGKMIINGKIATDLENKRIFVLDTRLINDSFEDKNSFENEMINILNQVNSAGNVILVIPHFSLFIEMSHSLGSNLDVLLSEYLKSSRINIVGISSRERYHNTIETNRGMMSAFEKIEINDIDQDDALSILTKEANRLEYAEDVFFLYEAIYEIAEDAARYYSSDIYSDKIIDLIQEVVSYVKSKDQRTITKNDVISIISSKTGIPIGNVNQEEKDELMRLEDKLHQRVIGQEIAIDAISKVIRRSRAGIQNPKRPIGSFLFMGPTGVGKTETVKALADVFFKNENKIIRFDMSEYNETGSVSKLIGENKNIGSLTKKITDNPYGVLLLDEFEKASTEVLDLFLQIIDEGSFTDSRGQNINAKNLIIVATSNAGSDLIFDAANKDVDLIEQKDLIIEEVIKRGIYKPELLNRFDSVVMFHVLNKNHLREIATLMIKKLNRRLSKEGLSVNISDTLVEYLVMIGSNPKFGAREMNRVIQDKIENEIAEGLLTNKIKSGDIVDFRINGQDLEII